MLCFHVMFVMLNKLLALPLMMMKILVEFEEHEAEEVEVK